MTPKELLQNLKNEAEQKGFALHADEEHCLEIAASLLQNKERYGYMCCPCRLPQEDKKLDKDIICPCDYRDEDIKVEGACFCSFFVRKKYSTDKDFFPEVDDKRPI